MIFENWSRHLGLAATPLFGPAADRAHVAMLDGVAGSFVLSDTSLEGGDAACDSAVARSWSWSSMMRHHVLVQEDTVAVTSASGGSTDRIRRRAVEDDLEGFLAFMERKSAPVTDIVDHVIETFQGLRARTCGSEQQQLSSFLALLALRLANRHVAAAEMPDLLDQLLPNAIDFGLRAEDLDGHSIDSDLARDFYATLLTDRRSGRGVEVDLTVRHAGAELFQAAQLAPPVRSAQGELWGMNAPPLRVRPHSLKEVAYTPVGLARILSEQALQGRRPETGRRLVIMDPTCGSGSFLVEAISALQRAGWKDPVTVAGYDISPTAVATARFAVACVTRDGVGFDVDAIIEKRDFLDTGSELVDPDVVLMNPPFRAWPDMSREEQTAVRSSLGANYSGRPDKSMAFVERALDVTKPGAVVTALLPGGVLASESGRKWRDGLSKIATPRMVATLGDHTLFRFATVNVCALSLLNTPADELGGDEAPDVQMLWASEVQGAASTALRTYRRTGRGATMVTAGADAKKSPSWNLYPLPLRDVLMKPNWLPAPGLLTIGDREALAGLQTRVDDLFAVHTGIRAGERDAFIITDAELRALPEKERRAFRPVAEKRAIGDGAIRSVDNIFSIGEDLATEKDLEAAVPVYLERHLAPARPTLQARARVADRWWRQSEPRNRWRTSTEPRIVSRQWFRNDGFAVDPDGTYAVVQGFAWFPTNALKKAVRAAPDAGDLIEVLRLYTVMLSSDVFFRVAREYSTNAGGGQITLQQKHIKHVPLPVIPEVITRKPHLLDEILDWEGRFPALDRRNAFASACYGFAVGG